MPILVMVLAAAAIGAFTGASMVSHPEAPPPGWKLGSLPAPARMKFLGWVTLGCAAALAIFGAVIVLAGWI